MSKDREIVGGDAQHPTAKKWCGKMQPHPRHNHYDSEEHVWYQCVFESDDQPFNSSEEGAAYITKLARGWMQ